MEPGSEVNLKNSCGKRWQELCFEDIVPAQDQARTELVLAVDFLVTYANKAPLISKPV